MESYRIVIKRTATNELERIERKDRIRIIERIRGLAKDPYPQSSKKLSGQEKYRVRQGDFRILYQVIHRELIISVVKIGHRREVYKN